MIKLRTRLLVGYGYMAVLLLLTAGTAGFGFFTINEAIDRILSENFRSISASFSMLEALEEQDELIRTRLLERREVEDQLAQADEEFREAVTNAEENITIEGESEIIEQLVQRFDAYVHIRNELLAEDMGLIALENFLHEVTPALDETRRSLFGLISINHDKIIEADEEAKATALHMVGLLGLLVTIAMVSMVFLSRALQQKILVRLKNLNDVVNEILNGNHGRRFDASLNDELGIVASQLNAALDERDEIQAEMRGRLNQQKQLVLGLLAESKKQIMLFGLDGKLIASACQTLKQREIDPVRAWLLDHRKQTVAAFRKNHEEIEMSKKLGGHQFEIRLLTAQKERPVGWLVRVVVNESISEQSPID